MEDSQDSNQAAMLAAMTMTGRELVETAREGMTAQVGIDLDAADRRRLQEWVRDLMAERVRLREERQAAQDRSAEIGRELVKIACPYRIGALMRRERQRRNRNGEMSARVELARITHIAMSWGGSCFRSPDFPELGFRLTGRWILKNGREGKRRLTLYAWEGWEPVEAMPNTPESPLASSEEAQDV